jgi:hypothetical protein
MYTWLAINEATTLQLAPKLLAKRPLDKTGPIETVAHPRKTREQSPKIATGLGSSSLKHIAQAPSPRRPTPLSRLPKENDLREHEAVVMVLLGSNGRSNRSASGATAEETATG